MRRIDAERLGDLAIHRIELRPRQLRDNRQRIAVLEYAAAGIGIRAPQRFGHQPDGVQAVTRLFGPIVDLANTDNNGNGLWILLGHARSPLSAMPSKRVACCNRNLRSCPLTMRRGRDLAHADACTAIELANLFRVHS